MAGDPHRLWLAASGRPPVEQLLRADVIRACVGLALDPAGRLWIATPTELYRLLDGALTGPIDPPARTQRLHAIAAGAGRAWVVTSAGLAVVDDEWYPVPWVSQSSNQPPLRTVAVSADAKYAWVGTDDSLLGAWCSRSDNTRWDPAILPPHPQDVLNNLGRCAIGGADRQVWIGTAGGLVTYAADDTFAFDATRSDVHSLALVEDGAIGGSNLALLTWPGGVAWLDGPAAQPVGLPRALQTGQDGRAYVLAGSAVWLVGAEASRVTEHASSSAGCFAQTPDLRWWVGTAHGVYCHTVNGWEFSGPSPSRVSELCVIGSVLWAATDAGLWSLHGDTWQPHEVVPGTERSICRAIAPATPAGALWVAIREGVIHYDPATGLPSLPYTTRNSGLPSCRVNALLETAGSLWVVTDSGTARLKLG